MVDAMMSGVNSVGGGYFDLIDPHTLFVDPGLHNTGLSPMEQTFHTNIIQPQAPSAQHPPNSLFNDALTTLPPTMQHLGFNNPPLDPAYNQALDMASGFGPTQKTATSPSTMSNLMAAAFMTTMGLAAENTDSAYIECGDGVAQPTCKGNPHWGEGHNYNEYCSTMCPQGICPMSLCVCTCSTMRNGGAKTPTGKCRAIETWDQPVNTYCAQSCNSANYGSDTCPSEVCICDLWGLWHNSSLSSSAKRDGI